MLPALPMVLELSIFISFIALFSYSALFLFVLRRGIRTGIIASFSLYLLCMIIWSLSALMKYADIGQLDPRIWVRLLILGSTAMPIAFFNFVSNFLSKDRRKWLFLGAMLYTLIQIASFQGYLFKDFRFSAGGIDYGYNLPFYLISGFWLFFIGFSTLDLLRDYRQTTIPHQQNRIRYLLLVIMVILIGSLSNLSQLRNWPVDIAFNALAGFIIAYAILRHHLLGIDVVFRKGLAYLLPLLIAGAGYFLMIYLALEVFHIYTGLHLFILALFIAILAAMVAQPLQSRTADWIDRLFFKEKYDSGLMLQRLSQTSASVLDQDQLTNLILGEVIQTMRIQWACFLLKQPDTSDFILSAQKGLGESLSFKLRKDHPILKFLAGKNQAVSSQETELFQHLKSLCNLEGCDLVKAGPELFLPLQGKDQLVGILVTGPKHGQEAYSPEDQQILNALAHQTAVAVDNAILFEREHLRRREAEILREASTAITSELDLNHVLDKILTYLEQVVPYNSACVFLLIEEGETLYAVAGRGFSDGKSVIGQRYSSQNILFRKVCELSGPLILDDAATDTRFKGWGGTSEVHGWMGVPLTARGEVTGVLTLDSYQTNAYSEAEAELAQAFANQAAIAIENARLFEAAQHQAEEADTLRLAAAAITASLHQDESIGRILEQLARVVPYDSASVQLLIDGHLEIVGGRGWEDMADVIGMRFPIPGDNPNTVVILERKPYIIGDAPAYHRPFQQGPHSHIHSWLGVPLVVQDRVIGMLALDSGQKEYFTANQARLAAAFADQVAIAIENARLFSEQRQRAEELATLFSTSTAVSAHMQIDAVLAEITRQITLALNGTSCYASIIDDNQKNLQVVAEFFGPEANPKEQVTDLGRVYSISESDWARYDNLQAFVTHISNPDADPAILEDLRNYGGKTALSLPLAARGRVIGELELWDSRRERTFSDAEIKLGQTIANQAAIALEQARLYELEKQRAEQLEALRATAADINSELELTKLLEVILRRAILLLSAEGGDLGLYDETTGDLEIVTSINMGKDFSGTRQVMGEGLMGRVAQTLEPLIIQDYMNWEGRSPHYLEGPWRAVMASPLMVHGRLLGVVGIVDVHPERQFTADDLVLLNLFVQQAAIAIDNARLYSEIRERALELEQLFGAAQDLATNPEPLAVLNQLARHLAQALEASHVRISEILPSLTPELEDRRLEVLAEYYEQSPHGFPSGSAIGSKYVLGEHPLIIQAIDEGIVIQYQQDNDDLTPGELAKLVLNDVISALVVPIMSKGITVAVAEVWESRRYRTYSDRQKHLAIALTQHAGTVVENSRLYAAEKRRANELDALHTATATLLSTLDLETLLNHILNEAMRSIPKAEKGSLLLLDPGSGEFEIRAVTGYLSDSDGKGMTLQQKKEFAEQAIRSRRPLLITDLERNSAYEANGGNGETQPIRSVIVAPMLLEDQDLGALMLASPTPDAFLMYDLDLLVSFATTAVAAIRNARLHAEVQRLAVTDPLTGLYNRRGLFELGDREIDRYRRSRRPLAAIMLDIDLFKHVNDTYSHAIGDQVLRTLSARCKEILRDTDILGRYGGEEFAILLPETELEYACLVAERLRNNLAHRPIMTDRGLVSITISLGVTAVYEDSPDLAVLLDRADTAMYAAKQAGRNRLAIVYPQSHKINIASPNE
jgi:diguanylate cyclase (GGDEF)-like protein